MKRTAAIVIAITLATALALPCLAAQRQGSSTMRSYSADRMSARTALCQGTREARQEFRQERRQERQQLRSEVGGQLPVVTTPAPTVEISE